MIDECESHTWDLLISQHIYSLWIFGLDNSRLNNRSRNWIVPAILDNGEDAWNIWTHQDSSCTSLTSIAIVQYLYLASLWRGHSLQAKHDSCSRAFSRLLFVRSSPYRRIGSLLMSNDVDESRSSLAAGSIALDCLFLFYFPWHAHTHLTISRCRRNHSFILDIQIHTQDDQTMLRHC